MRQPGLRLAPPPGVPNHSGFFGISSSARRFSFPMTQRTGICVFSCHVTVRSCRFLCFKIFPIRASELCDSPNFLTPIVVATSPFVWVRCGLPGSQSLAMPSRIVLRLRPGLADLFLGTFPRLPVCQPDRIARLLVFSNSPLRP